MSDRLDVLHIVLILVMVAMSLLLAVSHNQKRNIAMERDEQIVEKFIAQENYDALLLEFQEAVSCTVFIDPVVTIEAEITAYSPDSASCWPFNDGYTATMRDASLPGVAVDPSQIPFGSIVIIDGHPYQADDTGKAMRDAGKKGKTHIDLRLPTHEEAVAYGRQKKLVEVIYR